MLPSFKIYMDMIKLGMEAQAVVNMRMMGMAGLWPVAPSETSRMVTEKQFAMLDAINVTTNAALTGGMPETVLKDIIRQTRKRTTANVKRLSR